MNPEKEDLLRKIGTWIGIGLVFWTIILGINVVTVLFLQWVF